MTNQTDTTPSQLLYRCWTLPALLLLCTLVYLGGLFGGFQFDDFPNIVNNPALRALNGSMFRWETLAVSSNAGLLRRPISMLSFGMDYFFFGLSPSAFKLTNLVIHLANGVLFYQLVQRIATRLLPAAYRTTLDSRTLALFITSLWLLHPLNVSTVLYVVQRMDELSSLFVLLGLLCYAEGRERMARRERGLVIAVLGICVFGLLAAFSKENGALITVYALVIEFFCYRFSIGTTQENLLLKAFFGLTVALPIALFFTYLFVHPYWLANGYIGRDFTLYQRLLSEARILCDYLLWILVPAPRWMGLLHDDITVSTGLLHPATTLAAILFLFALLITAWKLRRRCPSFSFAVAWFLVGQSMESTIIPLELVFDHRNYLPMAGLLLGLVCTLTPWVRNKLNRRIVMACCSGLIFVLSGITAVWANTWGAPLRLALAEAANHPHSARAQYEAGREFILAGSASKDRDTAEKRAIPYFERGMELDANDIYNLIGLIQIHSLQGGPSLSNMAKNLTSRIRHTPAVAINPFLVLLTATNEGRVTLGRDQMASLIHAALDNPSFSHSMRAMILNDYGNYMFRIAHDYQAAISLTLAAAAEDPANPLLEVNLTKLAIALGDRNEAQNHLYKAEQLDKAKLNTATLTSLKKQLLMEPNINQDKTRTQHQ